MRHLLVVICLMCSTTVVAQRGMQEIGASFDIPSGVGIRYQYNVTDFLKVGAFADHLFKPDEAYKTFLGGDLYLYLSQPKRWRFYIVGGLGAGLWEEESKDVTKGTDFIYLIGLGLNCRITEQFSAFCDLRGFLSSTDRDGQPAIAIGVKYCF